MRTIAAALVSGTALVASTAVAAPALAATPVEIVAHTEFSTEVSAFESTLNGCETGTVANGAVFVAGTPWGGVFNGTKVFSCADGQSGFAVRLQARFGEGGSTGTWNVVDGWGDLAGIKGSGSLVGVPTASGIDDFYTGSTH